MTNRKLGEKSLFWDAGVMQLYPKINLRAKLGFPVSTGCRMLKSYSIPCEIWSCNIGKSLDKTSEIIGTLFSFPMAVFEFVEKECVWHIYSIQMYTLLIGVGYTRSFFQIPFSPPSEFFFICQNLKNTKRCN